jgi:hypothetical protein
MMIKPLNGPFRPGCLRPSILLACLLILAACNRDPAPVPTATPTSGSDSPAETPLALPPTNTPAATPEALSTGDFLAIDAYLQEIDQDVCQQAYETRREIEDLLAQGADVEELQAALDELIAELQNCAPAVTPTP